jgi:hypothetical protein
VHIATLLLVLLMRCQRTNFAVRVLVDSWVRVIC